MNHPRTPSKPAWRPPVVLSRDIWCQLPELHAGRGARGYVRRLGRGVAIALAAALLLLVGSPLLVLWAIA